MKENKKDNTVELKIDELKLDPEVLALYEGIEKERDYRNLRDNILKEGIIRDPITVALSPIECRGIIVKGCKRYRVHKETGIGFKYPPIYKHYESKFDLLKDAKDDNRDRRNLSDLEFVLTEINFLKLSDRFRQMAKMELYEYLHDQTGVSERQVQRILYILRNSPEKIKDILKGKQTIGGVYLSSTKRKNIGIIDGLKPVNEDEIEILPIEFGKQMWVDPRVYEMSEYKIPRILEDKISQERFDQDMKVLEKGVLNSGFLMPCYADEKRKIIDGYRRWCVAMEHGLKLLVIHRFYGDGREANIEKMFDSISANMILHPTPLEKGYKLFQLRECGLSTDQIAKKLGRSKKLVKALIQVYIDSEANKKDTVKLTKKGESFKK